MSVHTADVKLRPSSAAVVLFIQLWLLSQQSAVKWTCSSDNLASLDEVFNRRRTTYPQRWMMTLNCPLVSLPCILVSPQAPPLWLLCVCSASAAVWGFFPGTAPASSVPAAFVNERPLWVGVCLNTLWHICTEHHQILTQFQGGFPESNCFYFNALRLKHLWAFVKHSETKVYLIVA